MERYDPLRLERSTRDLVSRAAFLEVVEGRGTPNDGVWLDVSHLGAEVVERNFRGMVKRCRDFGRDLARERVEVGPTTHFMMGGVVIDAEGGAEDASASRPFDGKQTFRPALRRARMRVGYTGPTDWAVTVSPSRPSSAVSRAM